MRCAWRAGTSPPSVWCGNTRPSTTSPRSRVSSRATIRRLREPGPLSGREHATTTRAPKPARARTRSRPKAGPVTTPPAPTPAAERIGVVHLTAEYWPFARTGGLGAAVSGLATFQAAAGMPTTVVLPLYRQVRATAPSLERAGPPFTVTFGDRSETAWLYREQVGAAQGPQVVFIAPP